MASPVDTSVKFYRSDFPGAPSLSGSAGAFIGLADACLVNGFGLRTATSLVVSGGVATVTLPTDANNGNLLDSVILVAGVTGTLTALNGEQRVTEAGTTTLKFATAAADGTAAGTITVKTAAAGWEKVYSGTNKAAYRSLDVTGTRVFLRVDDSGTTSCRVVGYENMTDVDTGTGAFPTSADMSGGGYWLKSNTENATANRWDLFADRRAFIFSPQASSGASASTSGQSALFFGDFTPFKSVDPYAAGITYGNTLSTSNSRLGSLYDLSAGSNNLRLARSYTGLGSSIQGFLWPESGAVSETSSTSGENYLGAYPSPTDGVLRLSRLTVTQGAAYNNAATVLRGIIPGYLWVPMSNVGSTFQRGDKLVGAGALTGKKAYCIQTTSSFNIAAGSDLDRRSFVDITGPWR